MEPPIPSSSPIQVLPFEESSVVSQARLLSARNLLSAKSGIDIKTNINEFTKDENQKDMLIYEVEYIDLAKEERDKQEFLKQQRLIMIKPIVPFTIFNILIGLSLTFLVLLLIGVIGNINPTKYSSYDEKCQNMVECNPDKGLMCDYSTAKCDCDTTNNYFWSGSTCLQCPIGWTLSNSFCFKQTEIPTNYSTAESWCEMQNTHSTLLTISSATKYNVINTKWNSFTCPTGATCTYRLGCTDELTLSYLKCVDNTDILTSRMCTPTTPTIAGNRCLIAKKSGPNICLDYTQCDNIDKKLLFICQIA